MGLIFLKDEKMTELINSNPFLDEITDSIEKLQRILQDYKDNHGIIDDTDVLSRLEELTKKKQLELMKKAVRSVNTRKVVTNSRGYLQIVIDADGNRITSKTEYGLFSKCYLHYFGLFKDNNPTLSEAFREYYHWRLNYDTCCEATALQDMQTWMKFLENSELASMRMTDITAKHIMQEYRRIQKEYYLTKKAFNKISSIVNGTFRYVCCEMDNPPIEVNVAKSVEIKKMSFRPEDDNSDEVYSEDDKILICNELAKDKKSIYAYAIRFAFEFCLRISEIRALKWSDYNEKNGTLYIHHMIRYEKGNISVDTPRTKGSTNAGIRHYPVSKEAKRILDELKEITGDCEYIFANGHKKYPIAANKFNERLERLCNRLGVQYFPSHKIRFYMITKLYLARVPEDIIQYLAGHTEATMTRHYKRIQRSAPNIRKNLSIAIDFD